jgi:hypothetical protein
MTNAAFRLAALAAVGLALALPGPAIGFDSTGSQPAGAQSPDNFSAGDQYVETLPSTKGPKAAEGNPHKRARLSHDAKQKLREQGGSDTAQLMQIATSTQLGAPDQSLHKDAHKRDGESGPAVPSAAIDAVTGGHAGLGLLLLWLIVITAVGLGAAGYRRHRHKDSSTSD